MATSAHLWQVTEPVPALSAEPALAEALLEETAGLQVRCCRVLAFCAFVGLRVDDAW